MSHSLCLWWPHPPCPTHHVLGGAPTSLVPRLSTHHVPGGWWPHPPCPTHYVSGGPTHHAPPTLSLGEHPPSPHSPMAATLPLFSRARASSCSRYCSGETPGVCSNSPQRVGWQPTVQNRRSGGEGGGAASYSTFQHIIDTCTVEPLLKDIPEIRTPFTGRDLLP